MSEPITINVTAELIEAGKPNRLHLCPVALGCADAGLESPTVFSSRIFAGPSDRRKRYMIPKTVRAKIKRIDTGKKVRPFSFPLTEEAK